MKRLLLSKAGVTVLEGIIALGLLALVAGGAFAVLLAASRQISQPDMREEMLLAVERADNLLKSYVGVTDAYAGFLPEKLKGGPCCQSTDNTNACRNTLLVLPDDPDDAGDTINIDCLLPPICDRANSSFTYRVAQKEVQLGSSTSQWRAVLPYISYDITCNGYTLDVNR